MPSTQIVVITAMIASVNTTFAKRGVAQLGRGRRGRTCSTPATCASEPITRMPVVDTAQPPTQPRLGPIARVIHENVVPQSGSARFM